MKRLILRRGPSTDAGTFGTLIIDGEEFCHTAELPWRDNRVERSCIPAGVYTCVWKKSPTWGWCYEVTGVDGRTHVLIHKGNWAGDVELGLKTNVEGCILLGRAPAVMAPKPKDGKVWGPQKGVTSSEPTVAAFHAKMAEETFELEIIDA